MLRGYRFPMRTLLMGETDQPVEGRVIAGLGLGKVSSVSDRGSLACLRLDRREERPVLHV